MDFNPLMKWIIHSPTLFSLKYPVVDGSPFSDASIPEIQFRQNNSRLGFLYQDLCAQLFDAHPDYSIEAEELQLTENGRTLGAIDFIIHNHKTSAIEHWEVAVKFYLLLNQRWYGPNAKDRLDKKLNHMLTHQLRLSEHQLFIQRYPHWATLTRHLLMQGRLYINPFIDQSIPTECLGYSLNQSQIQGFWCYHSQADQINFPLYTLEKNQWLTGSHQHCLYEKKQPEYFTHCISDEGQFWFIVPDKWPG
ncbi:DUF1853 family protein [Vibrio quintilis]|uniref:DUF1853 family protein n=1 Tax=Vibrio quintilis TaxID=1117707 RepID=A0A1M7YTC1_9VIBR|nr:DUF1853 family protein [Vibrio quintilis]SHO55890.1 hypothetical protein VQ7734_01651 [Vibrio quintilis]